MPVGKVFNATENQVLFSPVTNYYKGKAMRASAAQSEADLEFKQTQTEVLKRSLEEDDGEKTRLELEELRLNVQKKRDELGDAELRRRADAYGPIIEEATKMAEAGDLDGSIEFANKELRIAAEKLGPEVLAEFQESMKAGGRPDKLEKDEISRIKYSIASFYEMLEADAAHVNMYNPDTGERIAVRPDSPEADEAAANGFLVGGTGDKFLGIDAAVGEKIKAADESYILKMVGQHFGGLIDEASGKWTILDPTKRRQASQVSALAAGMFASGVVKTRSGAVKKAMKAYGQEWEEPKDKVTDEAFDVEAAALELNVSVEDLQFTASKRGVSVEDVYNSIKAK